MEQSAMQMKEMFERWEKLANVNACHSCNVKPVLLPQLLIVGKEQSNLFYGMCYQCAKERHSKKAEKPSSRRYGRRRNQTLTKENHTLKTDGQTTITFFDELKNFLAQNPQQVILFDEKLQGANFSGINLNSSAFLNCDLTLSNFQYADLSQCLFLGSVLNNALLANTTLFNACLLGCDADYTYIESSNLREVVAGLDEDSLEKLESFITNKWIREVWKSGPSRDSGQQFEKRSLSQKWAFSGREAVLRASDLTGARFIRSDLKGTSLEYARLQDCNFSLAQLQDSSLSHASFGNTNFSGAQLTRVDLSSTFTPDPEPTSPIQEATVVFDDTDLTGSLLCNCYFLKATFNRVQAQRSDFRGIMLGPCSSLSGDFSNSRFNYAHLVGCSIGNKEEPINLRDSDFSHSHFVEVSIYAFDLDTSCFASSRFEGRREYKASSSMVIAARNDRRELILKMLEEIKEPLHPNSLTGAPSVEVHYIEPAAMNFESASLGNIYIDGIKFLTGNFSNSEIRLANESRCIFIACNFDNAFMVSPSNNFINEPLFEACSFHNGVIAERVNNHNMWVYKGCAFNSTAFICEDGNDCEANAANFKFVDCTFERTPLDDYFFNSLSYLVLKNCRLLDGQYLGLYKPETGKRRESERRTLDIIRNIVDRTVEFKGLTIVTNDGQNNDKAFADQQYLWNMFATNYRTLAITGLESDCLVRLRDLDLYFFKASDTGLDNKRWYEAVLLTFGLFSMCLFLSAFVAGIIGNIFPDFFGKKLLQSGIGIIILCAPILMSFRITFREKWMPVWSKAIYHYGEKPGHAFFSWIFVILIFGAFHWITGVASNYNWCMLCNQFDIRGTKSLFISSDGIIPYLYSFLNCIYFSTVTFTTLGFGDLQPLHLTKLYTAIEACIGATMMALFVLSFARRTAAR